LGRLLNGDPHRYHLLTQSLAEREIQNLVAPTLAAGNGQAPYTVLSAIRAKEELLSELNRGIEALKEAPLLTARELERAQILMAEDLANIRELLAESAVKARQILGKALDGRLIFHPVEEGGSPVLSKSKVGRLDVVVF